MDNLTPLAAEESPWQPGVKAWDRFVVKRPELGFKPGHYSFHNFLRRHRDTLIRADVIRRARNRFWVVHTERLIQVGFDCATGRPPEFPGGAT
jgi:hypothetical protein